MMARFVKQAESKSVFADQSIERQAAKQADRTLAPQNRCMRVDAGD